MAEYVGNLRFFSFWVYSQYTLGTVLLSVMSPSCHLASEVLNHKGCGSLGISDRRKLGLHLGGQQRNGRMDLFPTCSSDPLRSFASYIFTKTSE